MNVCVVLENALKWLHGCICFGKEAGARNRVFSFKVASDGGEKCFVCAASAAALVSSSNRFLLGVLQRVVVSCVRTSMRLLHLWLQIAEVQWLHDWCHVLLSCA